MFIITINSRLNLFERFRKLIIELDIIQCVIDFAYHDSIRLRKNISWADQNLHFASTHDLINSFMNTSNLINILQTSVESDSKIDQSITLSSKQSTMKMIDILLIEKFISTIRLIIETFFIVSAINDNLDRKNSKTHFLFDLSNRSFFEMNSLHSKQTLFVYIAYSQSEMMLYIRFICCQRNSISTRSEQFSCASKKRRMIDEAVVINFAQNCSIAWFFYS
jgi:hypothetical protein